MCAIYIMRKSDIRLFKIDVAGPASFIYSPGNDKFEKSEEQIEGSKGITERKHHCV